MSHPLASLPPLVVEGIIEHLSAKEKVMLCASAKALLPWLSAGSDLWQSVDFVAQASPARPLAVHLLQFAAWASERKAHLRSLTIRCIPPAVAGEAVSINRWSLKELAHADLPALEFLLGALAGAPRLVELRLDVHALPHCEWGRFYSPSLPALETLALSFPLLGLEALSLALLPRLRTLSLDGVQLCPSTLLPHSLTALEGRSARIDNWNSVDSVVGMPCCAPGLRSLSIKGGSDEQGQRSLCLCGLGQLTTLTSLSIDGPKLTVGDEEDEDEEEWEEEEGEQKEGPLQEMAHLRSLERLRLDSVSGLAIEGQPLSMPHWPELKILEICSVWDIADLRITGLPQLQELTVGRCDELVVLTVADLPALQKLVIRAHSWEGDEGLDQLSLANLPSLARMEASPEALELLPPLPGLTRITLAGNTSELEQAHLDVLAALPRLACLDVSWGFRLLSSTATEEQEAVAALRQQLPHLTIEGDS